MIITNGEAAGCDGCRGGFCSSTDDASGNAYARGEREKTGGPA
jgi:hypothetical protein